MMGRKLGLLSALSVMTLAMVMTGCGTTGANNTPPPPPPPPPGTSNLTVFAKDAAADNVLAFKIDVTSMGVTDSNGKSTTLATTPQSLELRHMELAPTVAVQAAGLPAGNYSTVTLTLANPVLAVFSAGVVTKVTNASLSNSTVSIPLSNFSLPSGGTQGLALDFDLASSVSINSSGAYVINPVVHSAAVSSTTAGMELVDTVGKIMSMASSPANSFNFQLLSGAATVIVVTDTSTVFDASIGKFSSLQTGQYVEVEGEFQSDGTFMAKSVELSASNPSLRMQGVVSSVSTDTSGTTLNLVVQN